MKKNSIPLIVIAVIALFLLKDVLGRVGFPDTHDGQNHLARMANYYLAVIQGQFPPRWAPNLEAGLGYTSLNFNYPLANIISLPFTAAKIQLEFTLKLLYAASLLGSGIGMYFYLSHKYSRFAATVGAIAYILAPYQLSNLYVRGNIGESLAFAILPWVIVLAKISLKSTQHQWIYALTLASFLLTHNLIVLLSLPVIIILLLLDSPAREVKSLIFPSAISFLLASFFWLPALIEKKFIVIDQSPLSIAQFAHHFPRIDQLFGSAWDHGYSYTFPVDGMDFSLGFVAIILTVIAIPTAFAHFRKSKYEIVILMMLLTTVFLMTSYSLPFWQLIPQTAIIQFPWRLLFFATFFSAILTGFVAQFFSTKLSVILIAIALISMSKYSLGINYFNHHNNHWFAFPLNTTILNENDPVWYDRLTAHQIKDSQPSNVIATDPSSSIIIEKWNGSSRAYTISSSTASAVIEKTIYFPGWQTKIDGQKINLGQYSQRHAGLINFDLQPGDHRIETSFTQQTPSRIIGNLMTFMGIIGVLYVYKQSRINQK